jgi:hypothetical protein
MMLSAWCEIIHCWLAVHFREAAPDFVEVSAFLPFTAVDHPMIMKNSSDAVTLFAELWLFAIPDT